MPKEEKAHAGEKKADICFVVAPIGAAGSETRQRSDKVLRHIIRPAADAAKLRVVRADEISESGIITNQVVDYLMSAKVVVADLTESNANVFYELAIRHALRKPFVHIVEAGHKIPFDVAASRAIVLDHKDLDSAADARQELERQIKAAIEPGAVVQSPFSVAVDLVSLQQSEDPEKRGLADVMATLSRLTQAVDALQYKLESSDLHTPRSIDLEVVDRWLRNAPRQEAPSSATCVHCAKEMPPGWKYRVCPYCRRDLHGARSDF